MLFYHYQSQWWRDILILESFIPQYFRFHCESSTYQCSTIIIYYHLRCAIALNSQYVIDLSRFWTGKICSPLCLGHWTSSQPNLAINPYSQMQTQQLSHSFTYPWIHQFVKFNLLFLSKVQEWSGSWKKLLKADVHITTDVYLHL
jgi:hypothetical protein